MMLPITSKLHSVARDQSHRAGLLSFTAANAIERICSGQTIDHSMETGCGLTTVLMSNISQRHIVFAYDDRNHSESSVLFALQSPLFRTDRVETVFGPTQQTLPAYNLPELDFALIDGPHGFPFPQLEYYHIYPRLKQNAILVMDDINIPHIWDMFACLAEDDMFEMIHICESKTGFLRRTNAPAISTTGDDWYSQRHNFRGWPQKIIPNSIWHPYSPISFNTGGNRSQYELLGWSHEEDWGSWTDGSEASIGFQWPEDIKNVQLEFLYAARSNVHVMLNGRQVGTLPGFPEEPMRQCHLKFETFESDKNEASVMIFKPESTFALGSWPRTRRLGLAIRSIAYTEI
jgi:hypothetical protein